MRSVGAARYRAHMTASHTGILNGMGTTQIAIRVPEDLLYEIDSMVESGALESRADAVRRGLQYVVEAARRERIDLEIVEGYRKVPPAGLDESLAEAALRASLLEEPW